MKKLLIIILIFSFLPIVSSFAEDKDKAPEKLSLLRKENFTTKSFHVNYEFVESQLNQDGIYARFTVSNSTDVTVAFSLKGSSFCYSRGFGGGSITTFYKQTEYLRAGEEKSFEVYAPLGFSGYGNRSFQFFDYSENVSDEDSKHTVNWELWRNKEKVFSVADSDALAGVNLRMLDFIRVLELETNTWGNLSEEQRQTLLTWLWLGGKLAVPENDFRNIVKDYPPLSIEETADGGRKNTDFEVAYGSGILSGRGEEHDFSVNPRSDRLTTCELKAPAPYEFQLDSLMLFLLLFAIVAGPGVIIYSRVKKQPVLILILIPVISVIACAALFVFAIFADGVTVKKAVKSIAYVDLKNRKTVIIQATGILKSALPLFETVKMPQDTMCKAYFISPDAFVLNKNGITTLNDALLSRTTAQIVTTKALNDSNQFLEVEENGDGDLKVLNRFNGTIKRVLAVNSSGKCKYYEGLLAANASADLKDIDKVPEMLYAPMFSPVNALNGNFAAAGSSRMGNNSYIVEFEKSPFRIDLLESGQEQRAESFDFAVGKYEGNKK